MILSESLPDQAQAGHNFLFADDLGT